MTPDPYFEKPAPPLPAANPETDLRKSRRFMRLLQHWVFWLEQASQGSCQGLSGAHFRAKAMSCRNIFF